MRRRSISTSSLSLRTIGSLWIGAVLLVLLVVSMACATVFESMHGSEQALFVFYQSWWFKLELGLLALNLIAAVVIRYPFSRRQVGFLATHISIVLILVGAWVTHYLGVEGQVTLAEGETTKEFSIRLDTLALANQAQNTSAVADLTGREFRGWTPADEPRSGVVRLDRLEVRVERFLPDSETRERVVNDASEARPAVEVEVKGATSAPIWIFEKQAARLGNQDARLRIVEDRDELQRILAESHAASPSRGSIQAEYQGARIDLALEQCQDQAVKFGDTGLTLQVLRYFSHATVGADKTVVNASEEPINPAVEVEIVGPNGAEKRLAFARFPEYRSMHSGPLMEELKIVFTAPLDAGPRAPIEFLLAQDGALAARFTDGRGQVTGQILELGSPAKVPWDSRTVTVLRRFDRARVETIREPITPVRDNRTPALMARVSSPSGTARFWLDKHRPLTFTVDGVPYRLSWSDKRVPLGFALTLNRFTVGRYPGENRPRSFESQITLTDAAAGRTQSRMISMNQPTSHGGYKFFQSSYYMDGKTTSSILSVSRDPGQPIVFTGYITLLIGMSTVLGMRVEDRKRMSNLATSHPESRTSRSLDLLQNSRRCASSWSRPNNRRAWGNGRTSLVASRNGKSTS